MRIATYNVEWFANLFDDEDRLVVDDGPSGRAGISRARQIEALGIVFTALDADAVMVIEAPNTGRRQNTVRALQAFAEAFDLRTRAAAMGFANETHQEIALLYDPDRLSARHDPRGAATGKKGAAGAPRFDGVLRVDLGIDGHEDLVRFSKPPLELAVTTSSGRALRLIGAHLKSKAPHGARTGEEMRRLGVTNRRKQLAQAVWLRARIDADLAAGDEVILLGDLNDGPGLDSYETVSGRSSVEIVLGDDLHDPHALSALAHPLAAQPVTARFFIEPEQRYLSALLDYVMVSPGLRDAARRWRIWHPFDDARCWRTPELRAALLAASDHFPVTLDIDI